MRMKLITGLAMAVAFGATAHATEFVQNGNFENASSGSFEYDSSQHTGSVANWTYNDPAGENSYNILFKTSTAVSGNPTTRFGASQGLWALPSNTGSFNIGTNFMALDGDRGSGGSNNVQGEIEQQINGLTVGAVYTLTFDFAAGQLQSRTGDTTEKLQVFLGGDMRTTDTLSVASKGAANWELETFTFTATSSSELLKFLSVGTPSGEPPMALLDNVSLQGPGVPEPATWGLMLVGVGLIGATLRRRRAAALA